MEREGPLSIEDDGWGLKLRLRRTDRRDGKGWKSEEGERGKMRMTRRKSESLSAIVVGG